MKDKKDEKRVKEEMRRLVAEEEIFAQLKMDQRQLFGEYVLKHELKGVLASLTEEERQVLQE